MMVMPHRREASEKAILAAASVRGQVWGRPKCPGTDECIAKAGHTQGNITQLKARQKKRMGSAGHASGTGRPYPVQGAADRDKSHASSITGEAPRQKTET